MEIRSLPKHENLTTGKKILWKRGEIAPKEQFLLFSTILRSNFSSFPQYLQYISTFKSPITHIFVKCGCLNYFFLNSANLICRGTDISNYFRESLGIRNKESRLYYYLSTDKLAFSNIITCPRTSKWSKSTCPTKICLPENWHFTYCWSKHMLWVF